jgi:hypothetical protein
MPQWIVERVVAGQIGIGAGLFVVVILMGAAIASAGYN